MIPFKVALVSSSAPGLPPDWVKNKLEAAGIDYVYRECGNDREFFETAGEAQLVWIFGGGTCCDVQRIGRLPRCQVILRTGTGTDNVPVDEATKLGIIVANTPLAVAPAVADHAAALLLALARRIAQQDRHMRRGVYDRFYAWPDSHICGATLGLVGFGSIGQLMAKRMSGFDVRTIAYDPAPSEEAAKRLDVRLVSLNELITGSDFISFHCPLTPHTRHLINDLRLRQMKPKAMIVNTARGQIIDEAALVAALREERIGGVALDVQEIEPLPADSPLLKMENVILTPHTAGHSDSMYDDFWRQSVDTILEVAAGRPPRWTVNRPAHPRLRV